MFKLAALIVSVFAWSSSSYGVHIWIAPSFDAENGTIGTEFRYVLPGKQPGQPLEVARGTLISFRNFTFMDCQVQTQSGEILSAVMPAYNKKHEGHFLYPILQPVGTEIVYFCADRPQFTGTLKVIAWP